VELAVTVSKEGRGGLVQGLVLFRETIVPALFFFLVRSEDASVRKAALSMIEQVGAPAVPFLTAELRAHRHPWYVVRNVIALLGTISEPHNEMATDAIVEYREHPRAQVREACLEALARILGPAAGPSLAGFLDDPEPHIVRRAIHHAGAIRYSEPTFVRRLLAMVLSPNGDVRAGAESLASAVFSALAKYGPDLLVTVPEVEETLLALVRRPSWRQRLTHWFRPRRRHVSKELAALVLRAVGSFGGSRSLQVAQDLAQHGPDAIREAAREAAARIEARFAPPPATGSSGEPAN